MNPTPAADSDTSDHEHFDVIIVGASMVGASLACALADAGLHIALLDRVMPDRTVPLEPDRFEPRVSALTSASVTLLQRLGVWDEVTRQRVSPYERMHVWEADGTASITFDAAQVQAEALGHIVENRIILAALHQRLDGLHGVERLQAEGVNGIRHGIDCVHVDLEGGRRLRAALLVGADGARSTVRGLAGFRIREWAYGHRAIVTTVRTGESHQDTAWQRFSDDGVLAFLPLRGPRAMEDRYCSIVWSLVPERAETYLALDETAFAERLGRAFEFRLGAVESVAERFSFPLHQIHATDCARGRIALAGDAAHSIHPLAGQGVNLGFRDVRELTDVILEAHRQGMPWDDPVVLRRYQRRCIGHNLAMTGVMEGFRRLYAEQPLALRWLRNTGMRTVDRLGPLKHRIMREAMGVTDSDVTG